MGFCPQAYVLHWDQNSRLPGLEEAAIWNMDELRQVERRARSDAPYPRTRFEIR